MCELHNKEAGPSSSNEGPNSPPSCAGRRGGMPPGRVAPNGGTRTQGGAVQIGSERAWQRRAGCKRADCETNNAASIKEARVDHSEGGVCVMSIQGGVQRRATFLLLDDVSAGLSTRRTDPRRCRARITFAAGLDWEGTKRASARFRPNHIFFVSPGPFFKKMTEASRRDITLEAAGCPFKRPRPAHCKNTQST